MNKDNELGFTGFVVYDLNPEVELVVPDVDLKNRYGYLTGHEDLTERNDNKFDAILSSSPGIPNLVHAGETPEAIANVKGINTGNQSIELTAVIDTLNEIDTDFENIKTSIFAMSTVEIENATITLPKTGYVEYIQRCDDFDFDEFVCNANWEILDLSFEDNGDAITFSVSELSAYSGGGTNLTKQSALSARDSTTTSASSLSDASSDVATDVSGAIQGNIKYPNDKIEFFANYSMENGSLIGSSLNGKGVACVINFSNGIGKVMGFVGAYQLYELDTAFKNSGIFEYNITCDGEMIGYQKQITIGSIVISPLPIDKYSVATILNASETLYQYGAEINKPVKWKRTIKNMNNAVEIEIPKESIKIKVNKIIDGSKTQLSHEESVVDANITEEVEEKGKKIKRD